MNEPWEEAPHIWKTKSSYFTWLRGALRKIWSDYPLRKDWKTNALRPVTPEERKKKVFHSSTKNVGQCVFCKEWFAGSRLEVDHKEQSGGCYDYSTASKFLWHCARVLTKDLQLACKPCHKIKSHSDRYGFTFEEAKKEKKRITFFKQKGPTLREALIKIGAKEDDLRNDTTRKAFYDSLE